MDHNTLYQLCLRIAELKGQNAYFDQASTLAVNAVLAAIPARIGSDRVVELGGRRIEVVRKQPRLSRRMKPNGKILIGRDPELWSKAMKVKINPQPKVRMTQAGKGWKVIELAAYQHVELPDPALWDVWAAASAVKAYRGYKATNTAEIKQLRDEVTDQFGDGEVIDFGGLRTARFKQTPEEQVRCDFDLLATLDPVVYARAVEEKFGEWQDVLDLRHLDRKPEEVDVRGVYAPDSAAASVSGAHSAVHETFAEDSSAPASAWGKNLDI